MHTTNYLNTFIEIAEDCPTTRDEITKGEMAKEREKFFSKGQPCFRSSPLGKRYGWGVHSDEKGRIAIYAMESPEYKKLAKDKSLEHTKAMRSKREK